MCSAELAWLCCAILREKFGKRPKDEAMNWTRGQKRTGTIVPLRNRGVVGRAGAIAIGGGVGREVNFCVRSRRSEAHWGMGLLGIIAGVSGAPVQD